jgi:hypothetical protein
MAPRLRGFKCGGRTQHGGVGEMAAYDLHANRQAVARKTGWYGCGWLTGHI